MDDVLINYGGAIKALSGGRVVGPGVTLGGRDMDGEYFHDRTYFGARGGDGVDTFFHHCLPVKGLTDEMNAELSDHVFPAAKAKRTETGVFFDVILDLADEYEKQVYAAAKAGKLGFSTGAPAHTVKKSADGAIDRWLISELSFTPKPADPRNRVVALKSYQDDDPDYSTLFEGLEIKALTDEETADEAVDEEGKVVRGTIDTLNAMPLKTYLLAMRGVMREFERRVGWIDHDAVSAKSGRTLSAANLSTMNDICAGMKDTHAAMKDHIARLEDMVTRHSGKSADPVSRTAHNAYMDYLYMQSHGGTITL